MRLFDLKCPKCELVYVDELLTTEEQENLPLCKECFTRLEIKICPIKGVIMRGIPCSASMITPKVEFVGKGYVKGDATTGGTKFEKGDW